VLGLDPIIDREEFYVFREIVRHLEKKRYGFADIMSAVGSNYDDHVRRLGLRLANLRVPDQAIWRTEGSQSALDILEDDWNWKCLVVDLGSVPTISEKMIVTDAILGKLWRTREQRRPVMIVIDEAHYFCPPQPTSKLQAQVTEHLVTIAGEGRKFGIYLALASQRPGKIHQNVLSQCENLFLMKMNSQSDLNVIGDVFSFVPRSFIEVAGTFKQGDVLIGGKVVKNPTFARFGKRLLEEGGSDIKKSWMSM
jgi:DNA helicase HerA-like ATPase